MKRLTTEQFINKCIILYKNKFDYSKVNYINSLNKIIIKCNIHNNWFEQFPFNHLIKEGCSSCLREKRKTINLSSKEEFILKAIDIHNHNFIYDKVIYINAKTKIEIICRVHGSFYQTPDKHLSGHGCMECAINSTRLNSFSFIEKAEKIHDNKYNYSLVNYFNYDSILKIICSIHGIFEQSAYVHLQGSGCQKCAKENLRKIVAYSLEDFIRISNLNHNNTYDYSFVNYVALDKKVIIICPIHGKFEQLAVTHMNGGNCIKCCIKCVSKPETEWLNYLNIPIENRQIKFKIKNKFYKFDAFDPKTNTIYEFYGDYWHGNPKIFNPNDMNRSNKKLFGDLYIQTINREKFLIKNGYKIIYIWEHDWKIKKDK